MEYTVEVKLRILTYNIHKGIGGLDRTYKLQRIINVLKLLNADFVFLQEVDNQAKRSNRDNQAELIAEALKMSHVWYGNVDVRGGGEYGNATFSKFPIQSSRNINLTIAPKKNRSCLEVTVDVPDFGMIRLLNCHLGLASIERKMQIDRLMQNLPHQSLHLDENLILGGDLNDVWGNVRTILSSDLLFDGGQPTETFPAFSPLRPLDGLFFRGSLKPSSHYVPDLKNERNASDHLPLVADFYKL